VAVGSDHSCGVTPGMLLYCWGNNDWRQLGTGNNTVAQTPVLINVPGNVVDVEAGPGFTCAVTQFGKAYCWGANSIGQVGDGTQISYGNSFVSLPSEVVGGLSMKQVDAGNQYACGLTQAGSAWCWGSNNGKFGNGPGNDSSSPKAVSGGITFASISTGYGHACGVAANAELWCWGSSGNGQLGVALPFSTVPVRAANNMLAAEVSASGIGTGSGAHTCAISQDRLTVQCFGRNDVGQLGNGQTTTGTAVNSAPVIVSGQKPLPKN
jgi:alpha-tubulin suppressor-like RCC1 family protein